MANIDKLFFLGSGASVCAGIPTFSTFKDKTEEIAESIDDTIFKETFKIWNFEGRMKENNNKPSWIEYEVDSSEL